MRFALALVCALAAVFHAARAFGVDTVEPQQLESPFVAGHDGYAIYRIPSLAVTKAGTLLAIAEGRTSLRDHSENDLVLRRSVDGGRHWLPLQIVASDRPNCLNNPTVVVLRETGRVLLMYQRYPRDKDERTVKEGVSGDETCLTFITSSDDDGQTWSKPSDITAQVKRPKVATSSATGPGIGIELHYTNRAGNHAGRIIVPFNQGPWGNWQVYAALSDDGGRSWKYGDIAPSGDDGGGNEVQMVELSDGRVMLNSRGSSGKRFRKVAVSADGGETWSELHDAPALPEPRCQGSILRYDDPTGAGKGTILFVNPAATKSRTHGTVRLSADDGATWPISRELVPGDFAYSCLAMLPDRSVACLYETDNYRRIALLRFTIDWLRGINHRD